MFPSVMSPTSSWWYGPSGGSTSASHAASFYHKPADTKLFRLGYTNAALLVRDRVLQGKTQPPAVNLKIFDFGMDGELSSILEALGFKPEIVKPTEAHIHLIQQKLSPHQIIFVSGLFQPPPREFIQAFTTFLQEGGRLILVHCASPLVAGILLGKVIPTAPSTTVNAPIHITGDRDLFKGFQNQEDIDLEFSRQTIDVPDKKETQILAKIISWREEPLVVRTPLGSGVAYVITSKLYTTPQTITSYEKLKSFLAEKGATQMTVAAWECLLKVGWKDALSGAVSAFPFLEFLASVILKEFESMPVPPPPLVSHIKEEQNGQEGTSAEQTMKQEP